MADLREPSMADIPELVRGDVETLRRLCAPYDSAWRALCNVMRALAAQPAPDVEAVGEIQFDPRPPFIAPAAWIERKAVFFDLAALPVGAKIYAAAPPASVGADAESLIRECIPGGSICDPQQVADSIRDYFRRIAGTGGE